MRSLEPAGALALAASSMMLATCLKLRSKRALKTPMAARSGGKFGAGDVAAVGVEVEVVAGADGGVHVGDGDAGVLRLGGG